MFNVVPCRAGLGNEVIRCGSRTWFPPETRLKVSFREE